jgi:signal transduction histidine kinase
MSQSSSADAAPPGGSPARRGAASALAPRNWRMAWRLTVLVAIPTVLGLALTGLRVTNATRSAEIYSQISRLADLGRQVTGLAQAMEDERSETAAFIADGRPAAGLLALHQKYVITDGRAAGVGRLVRQRGRGHLAQTRASVATALASIAELPGLRRHAAQGPVPALAVINGYSAAIAGLFQVSDGIADLSGNSALITSVRALGALSRMMDQAAQQQAILRVALAEGRFGPGALTALTTAQGRQAGDLVLFRSSATPEESRALSDTLAGPLAEQASAVEQRAITVGSGALALGAVASQQWWAGMSNTVGWMGHAEQQLAEWISAYAQALRRSAERSAIVTGGAGLAALALVLLVTMMMARSIVRPLRRLAVADLEVAGARLPAEVPTDEIGQVARAFDRVHREAERLAGEEARLRAGGGATSAGFFLRSRSLLDRLLELIDRLELSEDDPERLTSLFQLDHLATRMRRASDSALILAGHEISRHSTEPFPLVDLLRAAVSEIEDYDRVTLDVRQAASVSGSAAADTVHLLAELLENATTFSPRWAQVVMSGRAARDGGSLIKIADDGMGMPEEQLTQLNWQLAHPPLADVANARHIGLSAVAHLAARHGITVTLAMAPDGGATVEVYLPAALISPDAQPGGWLGPAGEALRNRAATPEPPAGPGTGTPGTGTPETVALTLSAPAASPEPMGAEMGGALPIFEAVESGYFRTLGRDLLRPSDPQAGRPAAGGPTSSGLAQRIPQASHVRAAAADQATRLSTATEAAERARDSLAGFQRGSRRALASRSAKQPAQNS